MSDEPTRDGRALMAAPTTDDTTTADPAPPDPTTTDGLATDKPASLEAVTVPAMTLRRSIARDLALMAVVFVAVFILLAGLLWLAVPSAERGATRASPTTLQSAADPTPVATTA